MKWYYLTEENEVAGPVSLQALRELNAAGALPSTTQVCREETEEWTSLAEVFSAELPDDEENTPEQPVDTVVDSADQPALQQKKRARLLVCVASGVFLVGGVTVFFVAQNRNDEAPPPTSNGSQELPAAVRHDTDLEELFQKGLRYFEGEKFSGEAAFKEEVEVKDYNLAFENFFAAASQGHPEAQYYLAVCFVAGTGTEEDLKKANEFLRKAADQGLAKAEFMLGVSLINGDGVEKDEKAGLSWIERAASQGEADAQWFLGLRFLRGDGVELNEERGTKLLRDAAEQGHAKACYDLALCYEEGVGVENDPEKASQYLGKSRMATFHLAKKGGTVLGADHPLVERDPEKQVDLGLSYMLAKDGLVESEKNAVYLFRKAAEKGNRRGEYCLGYAYSTGSGVEIDYKEAVKWLRKSADQNWPAAQFQLGECYFWGHGVEKNDKDALALFETALPSLPEADTPLCLNRIQVLKKRLGIESAEMAPVTEETTTSDEGTPSIKIVYAKYGRGKHADVTEKVKQYIEVEKRTFRVLRGPMGVDPAPGRNKSIYIRYQVNSETFVRWWKRNTLISREVLLKHAEEKMDSSTSDAERSLTQGAEQEDGDSGTALAALSVFQDGSLAEAKECIGILEARLAEDPEDERILLVKNTIMDVFRAEAMLTSVLAGGARFQEELKRKMRNLSMASEPSRLTGKVDRAAIQRIQNEIAGLKSKRENEINSAKRALGEALGTAMETIPSPDSKPLSAVWEKVAKRNGVKIP